MNIQEIWAGIIADGSIEDMREYEADQLSNRFSISPIEANILHYMIRQEYLDYPMSIENYFDAQIQGPMLNDDMREDMASMPLHSPCGQDCKLAIDACALLLAHSRAAYGDYWAKDFHPKADAQALIIAHCIDIILCYICG
jgi:hypothetical protein